MRGCLVRIKYASEVAQIRSAKTNFIANKAATKIQRQLRFYIFRLKIFKIKQACLFIQGYFRMKWLSSLFKKVRQSVRVIQRKAKQFLIRNLIIKKRMAEFLVKEQITYEQAYNYEKTNLFYLNEANQEDNDEQEYFNNGQNTLKEIDDNSQKRKIEFFIQIIDFEPLVTLSEIYSMGWASQYQQIVDDLTVDNQIQQIHVGYSHSMIVTQKKIYSWGWNSEYQLGRGTESVICQNSLKAQPISYNFQKVKQISVGNNHTFIVDCKGKLFGFGSNQNGQLGQKGSQNRVAPINILPPNEVIKEIKSKGDFNIAVTQCGKAYIWPLQFDDTPFVTEPFQINFQLKTAIIQVSCGHNYVMLVSSTGLLYSFGSDNSEGQQGHGDLIPKTETTLVDSLRQENSKIISVECGYKHTICKSSRGKVYTWGWGQRGQLGHGNFESYYYPKEVNLSEFKQHKVIQVAASFKSSMIVLNEGKIIWAGSNSQISQKCKFEEAIVPYIDRQDLIPIKIQTTWTKTLSIAYATYADCRNTKISNISRKKILENLVKQWEESSIQSVYAPFVQSISNNFKSKCFDLLNKNNKSQTKLQSFPYTSLQPIGNDNSTKLTEKNTSYFFNESSISEKQYTVTQNPPGSYLMNVAQQIQPQNKADETMQTQDQVVMNEEMKNKLSIIKVKIETLLQIPRQQWSKEDHQFMETVTDPEILDLLQTLN